jgi:hypothetical protein
MAYNPVGHRLCEQCSAIPRRDAMNSTKRGKGKPATKRGLKDLAPKKTSVAKGGSKVMASEAEMKKALIGNFPR